MRGFKIQISECIPILQTDPQAQLFICLTYAYKEVITTIQEDGAGKMQTKSHMDDHLTELSITFSNNHLHKHGLTNRELIDQVKHPHQKAILMGGCSFMYGEAHPVKIPFPNYFHFVALEKLALPKPLNLGEFITGMFLQNWQLVKASLQQSEIKTDGISEDDFLGIMNSDNASFALFANTHAAEQFSNKENLKIRNVEPEGIKII